MNLSPHFTLAELTRTSSGHPNQPGTTELAALTQLCTELLEPLRVLWCGPIKINSGFRSQAVNQAIGGAKGSQHLKGEAADVVPPIPAEEAMKRLNSAVQAGQFPGLGQAIVYRSGFLHISIDRNRAPRRQFLRSDAAGGSGGPYRAWVP
jgi:uncharacterized protein YcbK (DUF882 family)